MSENATFTKTEKKHRRLTIAFSAVIRDTSQDSDAIAKAAIALEQATLFTDVRHLSVSVQGAFTDVKPLPAPSDSAEPTAERAQSA
ncbi:MAG TPA: hypothetical protein VN976_22160 [Verrucomicrobiae bacterium]|nr:hypothetical protein [Verrucomicrobiae bacterium]